MVKDAEQFAETDKKRKEEIEIRNNADSLVYLAEKTKKDLADKLAKDQTEKIDKAVKDLKDALDSKDIEKIKVQSEELSKVLRDIGTAVYQQAAQQTQAQTPPPGGPNPQEGENVVDAEYKVNEEKK